VRAARGVTRNTTGRSQPHNQLNAVAAPREGEILEIGAVSVIAAENKRTIVRRERSRPRREVKTVVLGKSVNRLNGIPSGLSDSIGQVANAQRAYLLGPDWN
jgi:hypothetical protein